MLGKWWPKAARPHVNQQPLPMSRVPGIGSGCRWITQGKVMEIKVGRTYRAKKPSNSRGLVNDRTVVWVGSMEIQYDGPAVAYGRKLPKVSRAKFEAWADRDVTDELPQGEYASWPLTKL